MYDEHNFLALMLFLYSFIFCCSIADHNLNGIVLTRKSQSTLLYTYFVSMEIV